MPAIHITPFQFNLTGCKTLYNKELPHIEYLVDDFIMKSGLTYLVGSAGTFKTSIMLLTSICGARGKKVIDFNVKKPFKTLFIDEENGLINTKFKFKQIINGLDYDINDFKDDDIIFSNISSFKFDALHIVALDDLIKEYKPDLIVIDNIARCLVGSERDEKDVALIFNLIKPLIEKHSVSFVILHHTRKGNGITLDDISGSRDFAAQSDSAFILYENERKGDTKTFTLIHKKNKYGLEKPDKSFTVHGDDDKLIIKYTKTIAIKTQKISKNTFKETVGAVKDFFLTFEKNGHADFSEILEYVKGINVAGERTLHNVLDWMVKKKIIKKVTKGVYMQQS